LHEYYIEYYKNVIPKYFNYENSEYVKKFVEWLKKVIVDEIKDYYLVENVLYHTLFTNVLENFRKSTVLIDAIKKENKKAVEWLLKIKVDVYTRDDEGKTALMHAAQHSLFDAVKEMSENNNDLLYVLDNQGNSVLFYSVDSVFLYFYQNEKNLDYSHRNNLGEDLLIYCCKLKQYVFLEKIISKLDDLTHESIDGHTAAMYLVEEGRHNELKVLLEKMEERNNNAYMEYVKKYNDRTICILMNQFKRVYGQYILSEFKKYCDTLMVLDQMHFDFNVIIDEEGNTPIMFFLMTRDYCTSTYLLEKQKSIDLSIKNKNGISVTYLTLLVDKDDDIVMNYLLFHKNFDYKCSDALLNNLLMLFVYHGYSHYNFKIISRDRDLLTSVNNKFENIVIMSTKLRKLNSMFITEENINQQDFIGNTALYYAINFKDKEAINLLVYHKADQNIKNHKGISPLDLAKQMNDESILKILKKPIDPQKMKKKVKKEIKKVGLKPNIYEKEYEYLKEQLESLTYKPLKDMETLEMKNFFLNIYAKKYKAGVPFFMKISTRC